jgi:hypothetical protein
VVEVECVGEGARVSIDVLRYERETAENDSDANWLSCRVAAAGPFPGEFSAAVTTHELARFCESLARVAETLSGRVELAPIEGRFRLSLAFRNTGKADVTVEATTDEAGARASLALSFAADAGAVDRMLRQLRMAVTTFPVRGSSSRSLE